MFYIIQSNSYTCKQTEPPDAEQIAFLKDRRLRILCVDGDKLLGMKKDGTWREIVPEMGSALKQSLRGGVELIESEQE
jgi:hypothetical protein